MKLSNHTIIVDNYPKVGQNLVYSTRTQALVKIDQKLKEELYQLNSDFKSEESPHKENLEHLHRMGIVVKDEQEEQEKLKEHLNQIKYKHDKTCFTVSILTTYGCNFKCTYCFEESSRNTVKLSFENQEKTISWLKNKIEEFDYKRLYVNYYGGEPLLNQKAIEHISGEMKPWCEAKGVQFNMALQTNGYLLTPEIVDRYKKLNLVSIRISLDGVGEDHDRFRPLRGGGGTFDRIMKNIVACAPKIPIGISIGFEKGNVKPIEKLINYFEEVGILHKLGRIITSPIMPTLGPKDNAQAIRGSDCMCNSQDKVLADAMKKINSILESKGIFNTKSGMSTNICPLVRENGGVTIDQEGRLYKCNSLLGHPELAVGHVGDATYNEKGSEFRDLDVWKQCPTDCTYLPMCSGGCRMMAFVGESRSFKVASCKKPFLNEMAPEFIKRDYDKMTSKKEQKTPSSTTQNVQKQQSLV